MPLLRPTPLKLGLFYAAICLSSGVGTPFIGLWFQLHGLRGADIGVILATPMLARIVVGPALAVWADGFHLRRTSIMVLAAVSALAYGALLASSGFWPWLTAWFVGSITYQACTPLTDIIALRRAASDGFAYAVPRGMGSAAYILANVAMGSLIPHLPIDIIVEWLIATGVLILLGARWLVPGDPVREEPAAEPRHRLGGLRELLSDPIFVLMLLSVGFVQATHSFYYAFSTLIWRAQGIAPNWIGALWGFGVLIEIAFLWFGEPLRRRVRPEQLLVIGAAGAVVRWTALAFSPPLWLLFPIQALHALSFTAGFIASLELTQRLSPRVHASAAQSLNAGLSLGLMSGLATLASGPLYDHLGPLGYLAMSGSAAIGLAGSIYLVCKLRPQPQSAGS